MALFAASDLGHVGTLKVAFLSASDLGHVGTLRVAPFTASDLGHVGTLRVDFSTASDLGTLRVALFTASDLGPVLCCLPPLRLCVKDHSQEDSPAEMGSPRQLRWKARPRNVGDSADDTPLDTRPFGTLQPPFPSCDLL